MNQSTVSLGDSPNNNKRSVITEFYRFTDLLCSPVSPFESSQEKRKKKTKNWTHPGKYIWVLNSNGFFCTRMCSAPLSSAVNTGPVWCLTQVFLCVKHWYLCTLSVHLRKRVGQPHNKSEGCRTGYRQLLNLQSTCLAHENQIFGLFCKNFRDFHEFQTISAIDCSIQY